VYRSEQEPTWQVPLDLSFVLVHLYTSNYRSKHQQVLIGLPNQITKAEVETSKKTIRIPDFQHFSYNKINKNIIIHWKRVGKHYLIIVWKDMQKVWNCMCFLGSFYFSFGDLRTTCMSINRSSLFSITIYNGTEDGLSSITKTRYFVKSPKMLHYKFEIYLHVRLDVRW
jgi:hypothetical protein